MWAACASSGRSWDAEWNAAACVDAVGSLRDLIGRPASPAAAGIGPADYAGLAAAALADEVLVNAPRQPSAADIGQILADAAGAGR